jgi:hypothetical protein
MPRETTPERLKARSIAIQSEINLLDKQGFRMNEAIKKVASKYYLSPKSVERDYYKQHEAMIPQPGNPPSDR